MMKFTLLSILILTGIFLLLEVVARMALPYAIIQPIRYSENIEPSYYNLPFQHLNVQTIDALNLKGYWIQARSQPKGIIIFIHGIGGCKEHFLGLANEMSNHGMESIVFDSRAHGESEGQFTTYGYKEKEDISQIINHIKSVNDTIKIGIWGNSLGGAVALQAMAKDSRIAFGIIESTFRDLEEIIFDYQKDIINIPLGVYMKKAMKKAETLADFQIQQVKPINAVKKIDKPVLIAHGDQDKKIAHAYGKDLFDNLGSADKEWILVEGGQHFGLAETGGASYATQLLTFINKQIE